MQIILVDQFLSTSVSSVPRGPEVARYPPNDLDSWLLHSGVCKASETLIFSTGSHNQLTTAGLAKAMHPTSCWPRLSKKEPAARLSSAYCGAGWVLVSRLDLTLPAQGAGVD